MDNRGKGCRHSELSFLVTLTTSHITVPCFNSFVFICSLQAITIAAILMACLMIWGWFCNNQGVIFFIEVHLLQFNDQRDSILRHTRKEVDALLLWQLKRDHHPKLWYTSENVPSLSLYWQGTNACD
ncbi:unnamed protein product [Ixodes pacificus]